MHKDSTGQMMNQVMTPFQQRFGEPCLSRATLSVWEKMCLCRVMKDSPWSSQLISWMVACAVVAPFIERSPHKSMREWSPELALLHLTMPDHNLVMKSFWPVFVIELSDADVRLCHKACALLLVSFLVALSHGKVIFSDERAVYCSCLSWNVFLRG